MSVTETPERSPHQPESPSRAPEQAAPPSPAPSPPPSPALGAAPPSETTGPSEQSHEAVAPAQTYEAAAARVEEIIRRLDSGEGSLGETLELVKEGKALIEYCAGELEAVGGALEELRLDELVARLEREAGGAGT